MAGVENLLNLLTGEAYFGTGEAISTNLSTGEAPGRISPGHLDRVY